MVRVRESRVSANARAAFRALREQVGVSQAVLAAELGNAEATIKAWERGSSVHTPPRDAWDYLQQLAAEQEQAVRAAMALAQQSGGPLVMPYYRTQAIYDRYGPGAGDHQVVNATSRAIAAVLTANGVSVEFVAPGAGDEPVGEMT